MKRLSVVLLATVGFAAMAQAADLPTAKAPAPAAPAKPDCSTLWNWFQNSASDCPLSAYGFTLYGTLDVNALYNSLGSTYNPSTTQSTYGLAKSSYGPIYQFGYNGLSTSAIGIKMKEDILPYGWSLIGVLEAGVDPYAGMFVNGPRSLTDNNFSPANTSPWQTGNSDSSRAGQWYNAQAYIGVSNKTYGTLTFGRTNSLSLDVTAAYDPIAANAFSLIAYSSSFPGFGNTETVRNTAVTYRLTYQNFRAAAQIGVGGYAWDNGNTGIYQGQLGADFGALSVDGVVSYAQNAVSLSSYGGAAANEYCVKGTTNCYILQTNLAGAKAYYDPNTVLKGTLSNNFGAELGVKYKWNTVTFSGGYMYANLGNPSNSEENGFSTIASGISVPSGAVTSTAYYNPGTGKIAAPSYAYNKVLNTIWGGFKWSALSNLDFAAGVYYQMQNNYNSTWVTGKVNGVPYGYATGAACTGTGAFISSSKCGGSQAGVGFMVDYKPVKRLDVYAGLMLTNVYGGLANGYYSTYSVLSGGKVYTWNIAHTQAVDPTIGIRFRF
ncbi:putative porin [Roseiarcus fermentans]|uniref:Putative porin n=1 Tax=Roseiarcus fermentans TaxID=1473586 RepID=A0A366EME8_9HYPH|nr:porin [Roseiarcus fermentans]RBP03531.1 putative porin [Roseiarcus fermentans]